MKNPRGVVSKSVIGCTLLLFAGCSSSSGGGSSGGAQGGQSNTGSGGSSSVISSSGSGGQAGGASSSSSSQGAGQTAISSSTGQAGKTTGGQTTGTGGQGGKATTGGQTAGKTSGGETGGTTSGGQVAGATGGRGGAATAGTTGTTTGGKTGGSSGQAGSTGAGGQTSPGDGGLVSGCTGGKEWPTADPTKAGPFKVVTEKNVGPLAGALPDPIYGDKQQRFNIYRPESLKDYCHPIMIWANGYKDNPEQNPPDCIVSSSENRWCGQYSPILIHLASHGFVVMASLSTTTATAPVPTTIGLEWLLQQAEDPNNATYYHRLDTAHIGAYGHSMGGMSTCKSASDPRYSAIATISGTGTITGLHEPALFFCGGKENGVCDNTQKVVDSITTQPAMMINNINADHGSWAYEGANGVDISGMAAWFRLFLMNDTAQRKRFFGDGCTFCTDSRVKVYRNSLMTQ